MTKRSSSVALLSMCCLWLSSCPSPLDLATLNHVKDEKAPTIAVASPGAGTSCPAIVEVTGQATDASDDGGGTGKIALLSYSVDASIVSGTADVAVDGSFSFSFATTTLGDSFTLRITALDWNSNQTTVSIPLNKVTGNGIPSFTVAGGSRSVSLDWVPIPHTTSYTVYFTSDGSLPSAEHATSIQDIDPGHVVSGLTNGRQYIFMLEANPEPGWPLSSSSYQEIIPLSSRTLATRVSGETGRIRVEWNAIPGTDIFDVYRSTAVDGFYASYVRGFTGTTFIDTQVDDDTWYYYRVRPSSGNTLQGDAGGARTYPFNFHEPVLLSSYLPESNTVYDVAFAGSSLVVAGNYLELLDLENTSSPSLLGTSYLGLPNAVAVDGNVAYVADSNYGLILMDIGVWPPVRIGNPLDTGGDGEGVAYRDGYAYLADGWSGFRIVDVSPPTTPAVVGTYATAGPASDVVISYPYAYICVGGAGLLVLNISNPAVPQLVGSLDLAGVVSRIALNGNLAYVLYNFWDGPMMTGGVHIVDVSVPSSPALVPDSAGTSRSTYVTPGETMDVRIDGLFAYLAKYDRGIEVLNVTNPAYPTPVLAVDTPGFAERLDLSNATIAVHDTSRVLLFDAAYPVAGASVASQAVTGSQAFGVAVSGSLAFVVQWNNRLDIFDISAPSTPVHVGSYAGLDYPYCVEISGTTAYIGDESGLKILDVSDPGMPMLLGSLGTWGTIYDIDIVGEIAYLADENYGLQIVDVSDPVNPVLVRSYDDIPDNLYDVQVVGNLAYCAYSWLGLQILDVSNPVAPLVLGSITVPDNGRCLDIQGDYAYVGDESDTVHIVDISNPRAPLIVSTVNVGSSAFDIQVEGEYAYVSVDNIGVVIVDVADPLAPFRLGTCSLTGTKKSRNLRVSGKYLHVAASSTFEIFELASH